DPAIVPVDGTDPVAERRRVLPRRGEAAPKTPVADAPGSPPAATPPVADAPGSPNAGANLAALKKLAQAAGEKNRTLDTYEARFFRRETINDTAIPGEEVLIRYRTEPMAVYMKNIGEVGK